MEQIAAFWRTVAASDLVVLTDFDFTISQVDVGALITERLAPPPAQTFARLAAGQIGSRLFWLDSIAHVDLAAAHNLADTVQIDPGFPGFVRWCEDEGIPLSVVSDGFTLYIDRLLGRAGLSHLPVFANQMPEPGRLIFPHSNPVCDRCGCCKARIVRRARDHGARIIYAGDGSSDLYAASFADWVFAKGDLAEHLTQQGSPFYPLESFSQMHVTIQKGLHAFRSGAAPRHTTLKPNPLCTFAD